MSENGWKCLRCQRCNRVWVGWWTIRDVTPHRPISRSLRRLLESDCDGSVWYNVNSEIFSRWCDGRVYEVKKRVVLTLIRLGHDWAEIQLGYLRGDFR